MIRVNYKNRIGYFTKTEERENGKKKFKIWLCHANCLLAEMYFYNKKDDDGKVTPMAQIWGFFLDVPHAERCIDDGSYEGCSNFHFFQKEMNPDLWKLVKLMTSKGIKVTIE